MILSFEVLCDPSFEILCDPSIIPDWCLQLGNKQYTIKEDIIKFLSHKLELSARISSQDFQKGSGIDYGQNKWGRDIMVLTGSLSIHD